MVYAVILAGGRGLRLGAETPKQFLPLQDKPIIHWSVEQFSVHSMVDHIIIVCPSEEKDRLQKILNTYKPEKILPVVNGGTTRQDSCRNALNSQRFSDDDIIMFHDAARPFITETIITNCIVETKKHGAAAVYVPAIDTITELDSGFVKNIPPRKNLYYTQTPQGFRFSIIKTAHDQSQATGLPATDDVSLAINAGFAVRAIEGDYTNIKITTRHDYEMAKYLLKSLSENEVT